jgi:glycerol uptake facilitator-like aquaporin
MSEHYSNNIIVFNVCEFIGSIFLVIAAVAPVILFVNVLDAPIWVAVIADALSVGFVLFALIEIFGPICTAYFNPAVTLGMVIAKDISWFQALRYVIAQILGGLTGIFFCHLMFFDKIGIIVSVSNIERSGGAYIAEILGTFILALCILSLVHQKSDRVSLVTGLLVGGMLLSTSSTMFANPQVTIARVFTYSDAGIRPYDGIIFVFMQIMAAIIAVYFWKYYISKCVRTYTK